MQSQSQIQMNYQELFDSLKVLHEDLDLKLTQAQYDDDLDILRTVYLNITLNGPQHELKPLASLSKNDDFIPAKITYLKQLLAKKMEEQGTSVKELETDLEVAKQNVFKNQGKPKSQAAAQEILDDLEFINCVSYALQSAQQKINNQAAVPKSEEVKEEQQKDINFEALMSKWHEEYDPITDINEELNNVKSDIDRYKSKPTMSKKLKEQEKKLALLLLIIQAQQGPQEQKKPASDNLSDQEKQREIQTLQEELEVDSIENAQNEIEYEVQRRPRFLIKEDRLKEIDLRISKLKRFIQLLSIGIEQKLEPINLQIEIDVLCSQEEIKTKEDAQDELEFEQKRLSNIENKASAKYDKIVSRIAKLQRIIELFDNVANQKNDDYFHIDYSNAHPIAEVDRANCNQEQALEKAKNEMELYKDMPDSFQMNLTLIIYLSTLLLYRKKDEIFQNNEVQMRSWLDQTFGSLLQKYNNEGYENQEVRQYIQEVQNSCDSNHDLQNIIKNLRLVQIKHRFFNFKEFAQLLQLNEQSAEQLNDKDIILLLGSTGCGKSTTVQYLCGSKMKKTEIDALIHYSATHVINTDLLKVKCSPLAKSETRYVTPIQINLSKLGLREDQEITLVDTPGSHDTESIEVDISNQYGILRAVRKTNGVRVAILFSYLKLGSKGEDIKSLISFYAGMFKSIDENIVKSISYFFTHVPEKIQIENLRAQLEDLYEQMTEQEKQNENLVALLKDMVHKMADASSKGAKILRPLDCCPIKVHQGILQSTKLEDTSSFVERIDEKAKFQVLQQFKLHGKAIVSSIKRGDGKYAIFLLQELISFQKVFRSDQVFKNNIKLVVGEVIQLGQLMFKQGMQSLEKAFKISQNNNLTEKDLKLFLENTSLANQAIDPFYQNKLTSKFFLKNKRNQNAKIQSYQYIEYLRQLLEESLESVIQNTNNLAHPLWNRYLQKYLLTFKVLNDNRVVSDQVEFILFLDQNIIGRLQQIFRNSVVDLTIQTKNILLYMSLANCNIVEEFNNKSPIQAISENLSQLVASFNQLEDSFFSEVLNSYIQEIFENIKDKCKQIRDTQLRDIIEFIDKIKRASEQIDSEEEKKFFEEDFFFEVTQKHVDNITNYFLMQKNLCLNLQSITGINSQFLEELENDIIDLKKQFLQFYFRNEDKLKAVIKKKGSKHRNIKKVYDQIQQLRRVPFIEKDTFVSYNDVIKLLENLVEDKKQLVTKLIPEIDKLIKVKGSRIGSPLSRLEDGLRTIMVLKNFLPESNEFFLIIVDDLINKLTQLADNLKMEAQQKQLSLEDIKQIRELDEIYQQLNDIQKISKIIDETREIPNIDVIEIKCKIEEILKHVEIFLKKNQSSPEKILINRNQCSNVEQMLVFFHTINKESPLIKMLDFKDIPKNLQKELIQYIEQNAKKQLEQFKVNLDSIKNQCGIKSSSKKVEEKKIDEIEENNINIIEIQVSQDVKSICNILKTFKEAKKYPDLNQHFDHEETETKIFGLLREFLRELGDQMKRNTAADPQFNINIIIINSLIVLDSNMEGIEKSFKKIHAEAYEVLLGSQGESISRAQLALADKNYSEFNDIIARESEVDKLNKQSSKKRIQTLLQKHLNELDDKVKKQLQTINDQENDILELDNNILEIIDILQQIKEEFIEKSNCRKLQATVERFYRQLNNNAENIKEQSLQNIKNKQFYDAYKIINQTLNMMSKISLDSTNQEEQESIKKLVENTQQKVIDLQKQLDYLKKKIQEVANNFETVNKPSDLKSMNANKICDDLDLIIKEQGQQSEYVSYLEKINESIKTIYINSFKKFQEIIVAKDKMNVNLGYRKEISDIKLSLHYVSSHLKDELMEIIVNIEDQINQKIEQISKKLSEILSNTEIERDILNLDFENLSNQLEHRKYYLENDVKEKVDQQCLKMVKYFDKLLDKEPINDVFEKCLINFFYIKKENIQTHLNKETKDKMKALEQKVFDIFNELFLILNRQLQSLMNYKAGNKYHIIQDSQIKSPHLTKDKFLKSFQSIMKIPYKIQLNFYPSMKDKITYITQTGYEILKGIQNEFTQHKFDYKFKEAIDILKLHQQNQLPILCLKDQSYFTACTQLNDPELNMKVDYFNQYSIEDTYIEELKLPFQSQKQNVKEFLEKIKNNNSEDLQTYIQSLYVCIDALEIFSQNNDLFGELQPKKTVIKILQELETTIKNVGNQFSQQQIKKFFSQTSDDNDNIKFKANLDFFIKMKASYIKDETLENQFREIQMNMQKQAITASQEIINNKSDPNENHISQLLNKLEDLKEFFTEEVQKSFSQNQLQIIEFVKGSLQYKTDFIKKLSSVLNSSSQGLTIIEQHQKLQDLFNVQQMTSITDNELTILLKECIGGQILDSKQPIKNQSNNSIIEVPVIVQSYKRFEEKYNSYLQSLYDESSFNHIIVGILNSEINNQKQNIMLVSNILPDILACIFSIYTFNNKKQESTYRDFKDFKRQAYQIQPVFIIAIFRMFGLGYQKRYGQGKKLFNNIIDMDCKEENGIVISVACSIFGLYGHQVSCACANEFICMREIKKYHSLFEILKVQKLVIYQTLPQICENFIKSSSGTSCNYDLNIQYAFNQKILKVKLQIPKEKQKYLDKPKVILMLNIEVISSMEFQQKMFDLKIDLKNVDIDKLFSQAFEKSKEKGIFEKSLSFLKSLIFSDSPQFPSINENFQELIQLALEKEINKHVEKDGSISKPQNELKLNLLIGQFLLSEIPKNENIGYLMGLTSNFASINEQQMEIMKKYEIKDFTIIPSKIKQSPQTDLKIKDTQIEQFQEIQKLIQDLIEKQASVLVIFDSKETIIHFCNQISKFYSQISILSKGEVQIKEDQLLTIGNLKEQVNLITREDAIGIDFKIYNHKSDPKLGLHIIQTFQSETESEFLNFKGKASYHVKILSKKGIENQDLSNISMNFLQQDEIPKILMQHKESMNYRLKIFELLINNKMDDTQLQKFLRVKNELFKEPSNNIQQFKDNDLVTIVIIIEHNQALNKMFVDLMSRKIEDLFYKQKLDNKIYKFDAQKELLRLKIYFLGSSQPFEIQKQKDIETLTQKLKKNQLNYISYNITEVLITAFQDVKQTEPQANHIVYIGSQGLNFDTLKSNFPSNSLPPIYSYFINDQGKENFYKEFKNICKDGKLSETIQTSNFPSMLDQIQYDISNAFFIKHSDKITDENQKNDFKKQLNQNKNSIKK